MKLGRIGYALNPAAWSLAVKVPVSVALLMVMVSAVITNRVLARLTDIQERHLEQLASAFMDGLSASLIPSVVREDIWETFDTLDRARERYQGLNVTWTVVTGTQDTVLAASDPKAFPAEARLQAQVRANFADSHPVFIPPNSATAYLTRPLIYQDREIGRIYAEADIRPLLEERANVLSTLFLTNALLTFVLVIAGYFAVRRLVRPVRILAEHIERGAEGAVESIPEAVTNAQGREFKRLFTRYNAMARAVNEREELASQLAHEEKLASLGRLASGMAHEINNPLGGMFNAIDALKRHGERPNVRSTSIGLIEKALVGIRDQVRAMLATYREDARPRDLRADDIDDIQLLLTPVMARKQLEVKWQNDLSGTLALPAVPVRDALLNLLLNACEASPEKGAVTLIALRQGDDVLFEITDNGPGLPPDMRAYLGGPSTPMGPAGRRGGLGLWMVKRVCATLKGRLTAEPLREGGTRILCVLPLQQEELRNVA